MQVPLGEPVDGSLVDPGGQVYGLGLGARIEVPVTREIVSYFKPADLQGAIWTVELDAPVDPGDYEFVWMTSVPPPPPQTDPAFEAFIPLFVEDVGTTTGGSADGAGDFPLVDRTAVLPSVDDVAALERTRTYDADAVDQGTFNANTRPTDAEVKVLIDQAADEVLSLLVEAIDASLYPTVANAIALQTALLIEGSYFRDNLNVDTTNLYTQMLRNLVQGLDARIQTDYQQAYQSAGALRLT